MKHIPVIPARMGSQGLPFKNRMFFDRTADFIEEIDWFDTALVSTDDPVLLRKAKERGYQTRKRPDHLSGSKIPIKAVFDDLVEKFEINFQDVLWLFYIPLLYRKKRDFEEARRRIENEHIRSVCTFVAAEAHPYNCWRYDESLKELSQYISNDNFRRQDLPSAWTHHHYICCFRVDELSSLSQELINSKTEPFFLDDKMTKNLIEIDTPEDLEKWKRRYPS